MARHSTVARCGARAGHRRNAAAQHVRPPAKLDDVEVAARYLPGTQVRPAAGTTSSSSRGDSSASSSATSCCGHDGSDTRSHSSMSIQRRPCCCSTGSSTVSLIRRLRRSPIVVLDPGGLRCRYVISRASPADRETGRREPHEFLDGGRALPLCVDGGADFTPGVCMLEPGSTLLHTDGLVDGAIDPSIKGSRHCAWRRNKRPSTPTRSSTTLGMGILWRRAGRRCRTPRRPTCRGWL